VWRVGGGGGAPLGFIKKLWTGIRYLCRVAKVTPTMVDAALRTHRFITFFGKGSFFGEIGFRVRLYDLLIVRP